MRRARTPEEICAAQSLRYRVFVEECGATVPPSDHAAGLERDRFDAFADHWLLLDRKSQQVIGTQRTLDRAQAARAGGFYSAQEFDLAPLMNSDRQLLELGRSCMDPVHRGGAGVFLLWSALAQHVTDTGIDTLFGVASFPGTDENSVTEPLSYLKSSHLAPADLRVRAHASSFLGMNAASGVGIDRQRAVVGLPSLIKAYLRFGGVVGEGAFIDHAFNTIDICLILDTAKLSDRKARFLGHAQR